MALAASTAPVDYTQHRPERTLLYQIVAEHLETFLDEARSGYAWGAGPSRRVLVQEAGRLPILQRTAHVRNSR